MVSFVNLQVYPTSCTHYIFSRLNIFNLSHTLKCGESKVPDDRITIFDMLEKDMLHFNVLNKDKILWLRDAGFDTDSINYEICE